MHTLCDTKMLTSISSKYLMNVHVFGIGERFIILGFKILFTSSVIFNGWPDPPSYATIFNKLAERLMHSYLATMQPFLFQIPLFSWRYKE